MGRTISYKILAPAPIPKSTWRKIESVQSKMNDRFVWTCETLSLDPVDDEKRERFDLKPDAPSEPPVRGWGFTKVLDDELNGLLVLQFLRWVSRLLPTALIKAYDEGGLIAAGYVILEAGEMRLDDARIAGQRAYLEKHGLKRDLEELRIAVAVAEEDGIYLAPPPAMEYAAREDVAALDIPKSELSKLYLDKVVARMPFPWKKEQTA